MSAGARAPTDDTALLERLLARDETAFLELVDRYHGALVRTAGTFVRSRAVAEEVAQETWQGLLEALPRFEGRSSLKTFLFRILANRARTRGVREARNVPLAAEEESDGDALARRFAEGGGWAEPPGRWEVETPQALLERREALAALGTALEGLPPQQRAVVILRDVEGFDSDEVCNMLELSETNQRVLLHRGRTRLRGELETHFTK
ncbi:MAG: sigma-70 family RNA polymerase sigma factor [Myxococcales bacterium]|nr:sigma-70 family RNA polymerase sigma factor [Myxococcales bacterium]